MKLLAFAVLCLTHSLLAAKECDDKPKCKSEPMDISFVLDNSVTVTETGFQQSLTFLNNLLGEFEISQDKVRVSVITYGHGTYNGDAINFNSYNNKEDLLNAINSIRYRAGDSTDTGAGIDYAITNQMSDSRPRVKRVVVVLTDGDSQDEKRTKETAEKAHNMGLQVFAIGVGPQVTMQELYNIASEPTHVIVTTAYASLDHIKKQLLIQICNEQSDPPCRHSPTELMFVIDTSSSIGTAREFQLGLNFIEALLESFEINPSTIRVAAIMFGSRVYSEDEIKFNSYTTQQGVQDAILALPWHGGNTETGQGIDYMVANFVPEARKHAAKVAIVITDGESQNWTKTAESAERARKEGVKIIAVGVGRARTEGGELNIKELRKIAGYNGNIVMADDYSDLPRIHDQLVTLSCSNIDNGRHEIAQWHLASAGL